MVNLSLYPELKDVDPALVDDAVIGQIEAERAAIAKTQQQVSLVPDSYREFEKRNLDQIAFYASVIGILMKVREQFRDNQRICEFAEYFIRINQADMENISEEIENDRRTLKEIEGI
jgi:hypothetical protein